MLKTILRKNRKEKQEQASAEVEPQAATPGGLPTWVPPQGRDTNIHPFVSPAKGVKKGEAPHINKDNSPDFCYLSSADGTHIERHAT
jgi:hypothetical protein